MICCGLFKVVVIFGYQVFFGGCEMLLFYGWGIGGMQVIVVIFGVDDVFKVIDQGVDDIINVVFIWCFFVCIVGVVIIEWILEVMVIQICYWILEIVLSGEQIMVYQVLIFELLCFIEFFEVEIWIMYVFDDYGVMYVKFYEDIVIFGYIVISYVYLVMVDECYVMDFLLIFKFDNFKLDMSLVLMLFGVGCEKCLYVVLLFIWVVSLDFEDYFFEVQCWEESCVFCGSYEFYLDELIVDDCGGKCFVCFDIDYCMQWCVCQEEGEDV